MRAKVKVSTPKLLAALRAERAGLGREYKRELAEYPAKAKRYGVRVAAALRKAADAAEQGKLPECGYRGQVAVKVGGSVPSKPRLDTHAIDKLIRTVELVAEDTISMSTDDAARYL